MFALFSYRWTDSEYPCIAPHPTLALQSPTAGVITGGFNFQFALKSLPRFPDGLDIIQHICVILTIIKG
jgi:hypothetical protein